MRVTKISDPIDLSDAASKLRSSSNFRFVWQFHHLDDFRVNGSFNCRQVLDVIIADPALHEFLRSSMDDLYPRKFQIEPLHSHCEIRECREDFLDTFGSAVFDHLGAYSRELRPSTRQEKEYVEHLFSQYGEFVAYSIFSSTRSDCPVCQELNHHLFSNWFYSVAWDYIYFVAWPAHNTIWIGCFSDTD